MNSFVIGFASCFIFLTSWGQKSDETIIAFGSCNDEDKSQEMWTQILAQHPDVWIWGGDNIYAADNEPKEIMRARYKKQKTNTDYQKLINSCLVTGTWDDHDYGINDGGKFFKGKQASKELFVDFIGFKKNNPIRNHDGIYNSVVVGKGNREIEIINLDTRSFRDTVFKISLVDTLTNKTLTKYQINPSGDVLGDAQWKWLEAELTNSSAQLFIINSSIQFLAEDHRFEKWANLPLARQRMLNLIQRSNKRVLFISGDRHIAEFSKLTLPNLGYPLYDFTSSGLTHTWSEFWEEENKLRVGNLIIEKTYGLIKIDWSGETPKIVLQIRGLPKTPFAEQAISFETP